MFSNKTIVTMTVVDRLPMYSSSSKRTMGTLYSDNVLVTCHTLFFPNMLCHHFHPLQPLLILSCLHLSRTRQSTHYHLSAVLTVVRFIHPYRLQKPTLLMCTLHLLKQQSRQTGKLPIVVVLCHPCVQVKLNTFGMYQVSL